MAKRNTYGVDETLKASFNSTTIRQSFGYIWREKRLFLRAFLMQSTAMLVGLCGPMLSARALDVAVPDKNLPLLAALCGVMAGCIGVNILFTTLSARCVNTIGQNIVRNLRRDLYAHLQQLSFSYFDSRPHGKILVRVINYVNSVANMLSNGLISLFLQLFNLAFILVFMFRMSLPLALVVLGGVPFALGFILFIKPMQRRGWQAYSNKSSNLNAYLNESITCMKISQLFAREKYNTDVYDDLLQDAKKAWYSAVLPSNSVSPVIDMISRCVVAALMVCGILMQPAVSFGVLMAMISYSSQFWGPINQLANIYNDFINNVAYLERIFETINEPVEVTDGPGARVMPAIHGAVEFQDVSFGYEKDILVLKNVSFSVKAGESVALVGHTGSGKTTIINLLSRFYNCTAGVVTIDGQDIAGVTLASLRAQMGLMMQESFVFTGTVMDNLRYGNLTADDATLIRAAKLVCADEFIQALPQGYATVLSEGGSMLSQGEKQLLALARTMASDPKILILDEATSSVDTKTERQLQQGINKMLRGRTSFVVAHRLSTIRACNKILYIRDGEIAECGTHEELLAQKGLYWQLCQEQ
ncbi:MAG: ABC transporter ATP-binding protein [Gemmiger sp.]|nr:ABC transporter ATP-binding protein [Gemmiger sp.]